MKTFLLPGSVAACACACITGIAQAAPTSYHVVDLGGAAAYAINRHGAVAGQTSSGDPGEFDPRATDGRERVEQSFARAWQKKSGTGLRPVTDGISDPQLPITT